MAKVREVIIDALEDLVVQQDEAPIEASEAQAAIRFLNDMMTMLDAQGVTLGYTVVSSLSDTVTIPAGALMGVKANLAIALAPKYGRQITQELALRASEGMKAMLNLADITSNSMEYPSTLPIGSGNQCQPTSTPYYPDLQNTILTETGGSIALETDTEES